MPEFPIRRILKPFRLGAVALVLFGASDVARSQTIPEVRPDSIPAVSGKVEPKGLPMSYEPMLQRLEAAERRIRELEARPTSLERDAETNAELLMVDPTKADGKPATEAKKADGKPATEAVGKEGKKDDKAPSTMPKEKKWYEKLTIRGYTQVRTNETIDEDSFEAPAQSPGDSSIGDSKNVLIRRARVIISGDVSDYLAVYLQTDFAANVPGSTDSNQFAQIRDWYADLYVDKTKIHRFRLGQSKVPYGFENLQSSSNRAPLDRNDALNSAVRNERDLGVFYYWTPLEAQELYKYVIDNNLKGSGNYGVFGLGVYNGQGGSFQEQNNNMHTVARLQYPFLFGNGQIAEVGVQAYTGKYAVLSSTLRANGRGASIRPNNTLEQGNRAGIRDERIAWTAAIFPQPFGFQAEWTVGRGPALNDAQTSVDETSLQGGYLMAIYKYESADAGVFFPFVRWQYFRGGYKSERNAPYARINETEVGLEWQPRKEFEFTVVYTNTDRTNTSTTDRVGFRNYRQFDGELLRAQVQFNY